MRAKFNWIFGSFLVAAIAVAGCSSDDDNKNNNGGGAGGSGGQTTDGGGGSGGNDEGDGGEVVPGACENEADKAAGKAGYCPGNKSVSTIVSECAMDCLTSEDETCTSKCVDEGTDSALSANCRDCYIDLTKCGSANCVSECLGKAGTEGCISCLCGENKKSIDCYAAFNECSGLGTTYCEEVKNGTFTGYPEPDPAAECEEEGS